MYLPYMAVVFHLLSTRQISCLFRFATAVTLKKLETDDDNNSVEFLNVRGKQLRGART
jgi:hypothetical protein